jgi:hypothetical protein
MAPPEEGFRTRARERDAQGEKERDAQGEKERASEVPRPHTAALSSWVSLLIWGDASVPAATPGPAALFLCLCISGDGAAFAMFSFECSSDLEFCAADLDMEGMGREEEAELVEAAAASCLALCSSTCTRRKDSSAWGVFMCERVRMCVRARSRRLAHSGQHIKHK